MTTSSTANEGEPQDYQVSLAAVPGSRLGRTFAVIADVLTAVIGDGWAHRGQPFAAMDASPVGRVWN